ncbi:MAG: hypothetical protein JWQ48_1037 [Conexibacter sp.]|nr:hypothetical protein [Conexibacter sp.]
MGMRGTGVKLTMAALLAAAAGGCGAGHSSIAAPKPRPSATTATAPAPAAPTPTVPTPTDLVPAPGGARPSQPPGPPAIPLVRGSGAPIGALTRFTYTVNTFPSLPRAFVPGGIPAGTRAGACTVPTPSAPDRAELLATARRQTPGTILPLRDDTILLADCGAEGYWAMLTWTWVRGGRSATYVDELRYDGAGRWTGTATGVQPGCRMPLDAAAAWQIDVSPCGASPRGGGTPKSQPHPTPLRPRPTPPKGARPQPTPTPRTPREPPGTLLI